MNYIGTEHTPLFLNRRLSPLRGGASPAVDDARIREAAQEFEAVLLTSLFQVMEQSVSTIADGDQDCARSNFRDFGVQELASAVAASGGMGIAKMIVPYLARVGKLETAGRSPAERFGVEIKEFSAIADTRIAGRTPGENR